MNNSYYDTPRLDLLKHIPQGAQTILDVGCGTGALGVAIKEKCGNQIEVHGIEINSKVAKIAQNRLNTVQIGNIESLDLPYNPNFFDCIVYGDVLEHLVNPWEIIKKHKTILSKTGCMIASIPNIAHYKIIKMLKKGLWEYQDSGIMDKTHLRFFTKSTMLDLFVQAELKPVIIDKRLIGNEFWRIRDKIFNSEHCVQQFIIRAIQ